MAILCVHHGDCIDGFSAAWAVARALGAEAPVRLFAADHGAPPPAPDGDQVVMVDFSYPRAQTLALAAEARALLVLDHHKTAAAELAELPAPPPDWAAYAALAAAAPAGGAHALFDLERSGAGLAWRFLRPGVPPPRLIDYVEEHDLGRAALPHAAEIAAHLLSLEHRLETWDAAAARLESADGFAAAAAEGAAILRKHARDLEILLPLTARRAVVAGHDVPVANLPPTYAGDAALRLAEGEPFAACWYDRADGARVFSLRSVEGGRDVAEIARGLGGGGHARAAAFRAAPGDFGIL